MAAETATIRVTRETRDLLAQQATERGVSLSAMLADLAHDVAREAIFRAERDATRADAGVAAVEAEDREWETTLGDGVD
jgi:predicted kinase